jgi:DNA-directed RNA polymerase specialized sigma subunit
MTENLRYKKEYYFNMYFKQAELVKQTRELIEQLNYTKKEIVESETYMKAMGYDDMPHNPNTNANTLLDKIIRKEERLDSIDNRINKALTKQENDFIVFEKIDIMMEHLTENQRQVFILTYKEKMRRVEVAYTIGITERAVQYIKKEIFEKADFIKED